MIDAPFRADPAIARRMEDLAARVGPAVEAEVAGFAGRPRTDPGDGRTIASRIEVLDWGHTKLPAPA